MYKIYFENRFIEIKQNFDTLNTSNNIKLIRYKNNKSFQKAVTDFKKDTNIVCLQVKTDKPKKVFKKLKSMFKHIHAAGGLVINNEEKLLIIRRNDMWDLPKGKVENNETKPVAAIREVEEECGINGLSILKKIGKTYHTYEFKGNGILKTTHWYLMRYEGNEIPVPQTIEGITQAVWKSKKAVEECIYEVYESLKNIFTFFIND